MIFFSPPVSCPWCVFPGSSSAGWSCDGLLGSLWSWWAGQESSSFLSFLSPAVFIRLPWSLLFFFWYFEVEVSNMVHTVKAWRNFCPVSQPLICWGPWCHWHVDNSWTVAVHPMDASTFFFELFSAASVCQRDPKSEFLELCRVPGLLLTLNKGIKTWTENSEFAWEPYRSCQTDISSVWCFEYLKWSHLETRCSISLLPRPKSGRGWCHTSDMLGRGRENNRCL